MPFVMGDVMSDQSKKEYTVEIRTLDQEAETIGEMLVSAANDEEAIALARVWAPEECARRGVKNAWLVVVGKQGQPPILAESVFD
jgi:hypothetical protein